MSRCSTLVRLAVAQREGRQRLTSDGMVRETGEIWERAVAAAAGRQGLDASAWHYWTRGLEWIEEQRGRKSA